VDVVVAEPPFALLADRIDPLLTPLDDGRTRLHHWERFGGLLLPIAKGMIYDDTVASFHALNAALAARASAH
jgi:hypothetical protein